MLVKLDDLPKEMPHWVKVCNCADCGNLLTAISTAKLLQKMGRMRGQEPELVCGFPLSRMDSVAVIIRDRPYCEKCSSVPAPVYLPD